MGHRRREEDSWSTHDKYSQAEGTADIVGLVDGEDDGQRLGSNVGELEGRIDGAIDGMTERDG
eukprot:scaffold59_cov189-Chaetoceros_neogracile.AAC.9